MKPSRVSVGPATYENWHAANANAEYEAACEYPLYTDAQLSGEVTSGIGPYKVFNTVPLRYDRGVVRVAAVLRVASHLELEPPKLSASTSGAYHGGTATDEFAALASLIVGARFRAGSASRWFDSHGDPSGKPIEWGAREKP